MAWQDRIREAAYTPPDGRRLTFQYENVGRNVNKKTTNFEFPSADGSYIQDLGREGRKFPMQLFFTGNDHDTEATAFEDALLQRGPGLLEHPFYGNFSVVPFGEISRRDDLKTAGNQSIIEVTFWETIEAIYPLVERDAAAAVMEALGMQQEESSGFFAGLVDKATALRESAFGMTVEEVINTVSEAVGTVTEIAGEAAEIFNDIQTSINRGIDVLIAQPLTLANQIVQLIRAPGRSLALISDRLGAFGNLISNTIEYRVPDQPTLVDSNNFLINDLTATAAISGSVVASLSGNFQSRSEAIATAEVILSQFDAVNEWREQQFSALPNLVDTGESYQALQETVALVVGYLIEQSFSLRQERVIVLDRERTIVDLSADLYGDVTDSNLNFLINSNNLTGSEILELPRGRRISYYV